jgi:hypothetical protein
MEARSRIRAQKWNSKEKDAKREEGGKRKKIKCVWTEEEE